MQKQYAVTHTDAEWRKMLTPDQYAVMREHGTERPGSCALNYEKRNGTFSCAGCGQISRSVRLPSRSRMKKCNCTRAGWLST